MPQTFILPFSKISKRDVKLAGGKGASLGEMTQNKIPVPPGFVILAGAFDRFLAETDLKADIPTQLKKVNYKDINSVEKASKTIHDLIHDERMPKDLQLLILGEFKDLWSNSAYAPRKLGASAGKFVAVRSSATAEDSSTASWAGELETYLNTTEKNLLGRVKDCWSSLFTPRAIFYRFEKGLRNSKVSVAVVIQQMVDSEISGITFTVHPVTKNKNQMIIEAGFGLGEAIVSGQITPDSYVVDKRDFSIIDINIAEQKKMLVKKPGSGNVWKDVHCRRKECQKLNGQQIIALAKLCLQIEKHYGKPQDIEWAFAGGKFYITQSRPITTL
ncbi:MAG: hypothetical protein A2663_00470 [Candidatus Buchananbacteria bacterium RIFCSPHIGHO2_01_FULL_46_12]|uniref:Phosphoenolpyruvate synthase n=1 Tax=Candidatus Buchananbacteria bacterium RIFCSPHIGHO2_01_FULL_46_12 TaxID=1797536 RepID=A0A1G1Y2Y4_9BACT|nr:MAG: hypothetical protein A2663_00470 [Candidatus Buchananbacteria bacterium RIFCSPHIGHO2_01_FULL_46_12]